MRTIEMLATVTPDGKLLAEVPVGVPPGEHRVVLVIHEHEAADDDAGELVRAASTTLGFWDNPQDDEDWNDA